MQKRNPNLVGLITLTKTILLVLKLDLFEYILFYCNGIELNFKNLYRPLPTMNDKYIKKMMQMF